MADVARAPTAEIIAVGSELLTPFRLDTNSLFLTGRLNDLGIDVRRKTAVGDDPQELGGALRGSLERTDVVILTGGLGPTADDVTREAVSSVLARPMQEDAAVLEAIRARFERRGAPMPAINRRQALVPEGARVLPNPNGTAPGLTLDLDDHVIALLPGPPRELQPMFDAHVLPLLAARWPGGRLHRRVVKVTGRSESQVEEIAHPIYSTLSTPEVAITTSILASPGQIELQLAASGRQPAAIDAALDAGVERLASALAPAVFSTDGRSLEVAVCDLLRERGWKIAAAESCTGGLLLGRLTDVPGSSAMVLGGVVAYDNQVKIDALGVPAEMIAAHGAVSAEVARAMAEGARRRFGADVAVAITGIAGPSGGTEAKPVGTVALALDGPEPVARVVWFPGDRAMVRALSVAAALDLVRRAASGPLQA